jgi:hypothetical protein
LALLAVGIAASSASAKLMAHFQQTTVQLGQSAVVIVALPYSGPLRAGLVLKTDARRAQHGDADVVRGLTSVAPLVMISPATGAVHRSTRVSISTTALSAGTYLLVLQVRNRNGRWVSYVPGLFVPHRAPVTVHVVP